MAFLDTEGNLREIDTIIYGTGFAATEFMAPMQITGLDGRTLKRHMERWCRSIPWLNCEWLSKLLYALWSKYQSWAQLNCVYD